MASQAALSIRPRDVALIAVAVVAGVAVALVDSSPGWDDTGITAGLLVLGGAVAGALDGRRPWLWTLLIGAPLPIIEVPTSGSGAPLVALLFAAIGVSLGVLVRRVVQAGARPT